MIVELDNWIAKIRQLPKMADAVAPKAAEALLESTRAAIAAQRSPDGQAWAPAHDGRQMLMRAIGQLEASASRGVIILRLTGKNAVRHHLGVARGRIQRQIIPTKAEASVLDAVRDAAQAEFTRVLGG